MIGKKNIVFGFLFLVITASLGPYMVLNYGTWTKANQDKQPVLSELQTIKADSYEKDLEPISAEDLAKLNTEGLLMINRLINAETEIDFIKGGPHAHGNLEAVLNIIVGIVLGFLACKPIMKQIISWLFILGTLLHSGLLIFERVFFMEWASVLLNTGLGPVMILAGLLLTGIMAAKGFEGRLVKDD